MLKLKLPVKLVDKQKSYSTLKNEIQSKNSDTVSEYSSDRRVYWPETQTKSSLYDEQRLNIIFRLNPLIFTKVIAPKSNFEPF